MNRFGNFGGALGDVDPFGGEAPCRRLNQDCITEAACPARAASRPCWLVKDVACCPRNDKSRCCYCSVYLAYLDHKDGDRVRPVAMRSAEDAGFASLGRNAAAHPGQKVDEIRYIRHTERNDQRR